MMVNIFINIIRIKSIERVSEWKVSGNRIISINGHKVCSTKDSVDMDDWGDVGSILRKVRCDYPHSRVFIRWITYPGEPMYKCARIYYAFMFEWKKKSYTSNIKAKHPIHRGICIDEDTIISTRTLPPDIDSMYPLTAHSTNPWNVTWCIEGGNSRWIYTDLCTKFWEVRLGGCARRHLRMRIRLVLVMYKPPDEIGEIRFINCIRNNVRIGPLF